MQRDFINLNFAGAVSIIGVTIAISDFFSGTIWLLTALVWAGLIYKIAIISFNAIKEGIKKLL